MSIERTEQEINEVIDACADVIATEQSDCPGMTYEEGIRYALEWVLGQDYPL